MTSPRSRGIREASEAPWRGRRAPSPSGARSTLLPGPGLAGLPRLPLCLDGAPPAPRPRTRQESPRYNHAAAAPHLLLGPGCGTPTDRPGRQGQGGYQQQQQQVEAAHDAPVPAACHRSRLSGLRFPGPPAVTSPGTRVLRLPSPPPLGLLLPPRHRLRVASPLRCAARSLSLPRPRPRSNLRNPGAGLSWEAQASEPRGRRGPLPCRRKRGRKGRGRGIGIISNAIAGNGRKREAS